MRRSCCIILVARLTAVINTQLFLPRVSSPIAMEIWLIHYTHFSVSLSLCVCFCMSTRKAKPEGHFLNNGDNNTGELPCVWWPTCIKLNLLQCAFPLLYSHLLYVWCLFPKSVPCSSPCGHPYSNLLPSSLRVSSRGAVLVCSRWSWDG